MRAWNARFIVAAVTIVSAACRSTTVGGDEPDRPGAAAAIAPPRQTSAARLSEASATAQGSQSLASADETDLPPLGHAEWLERLDLDGGGVAYVTPPLGARGPRPIVFAVHGIWDRAEWACGGWRLGTDNFAFVLCPQGSPKGNDRYGWTSADEIERALRAAVPALRRRFGKYVAEGPMLYAGFSQGAYLARPILLEDPRRFPNAVFAEGGYDTLDDPEFARAFARGGGHRIAIICGGPACFARAERAKKILEQNGLEVVIGGDASAGHNLNGRMQNSIRKVWPWVMPTR
jgi:predicted esterase